MPDDPEEHEAGGEPAAQGKKLQARQGRVMEVGFANLAELAHDVNHKRQQTGPETCPRRDPQLGGPGRAGDDPGKREDRAHDHRENDPLHGGGDEGCHDRIVVSETNFGFEA
jgi:hypothetical protein